MFKPAALCVTGRVSKAKSRSTLTKAYCQVSNCKRKMTLRDAAWSHVPCRMMWARLLASKTHCPSPLQSSSSAYRNVPHWWCKMATSAANLAGHASGCRGQSLIATERVCHRTSGRQGEGLASERRYAKSAKCCEAVQVVRAAVWRHGDPKKTQASFTPWVCQSTFDLVMLLGSDMSSWPSPLPRASSGMGPVGSQELNSSHRQSSSCTAQSRISRREH